MLTILPGKRLWIMVFMIDVTESIEEKPVFGFWMYPRKFKDRAENWAEGVQFWVNCADVLIKERFCDFASLRAEWQLVFVTSFYCAQNDRVSNRVRKNICIPWEVDQSHKTECSLIHCKPSIVSFCTEDIFVRSCRIHHRFLNLYNISRLSAHILKQINQQS